MLRHLIGAANAIRAEMGAEIVALGHEYSPAASHLIVNLPPEGLGMSELADRLRLTPQRTGQLVQNLESFGYVERVPAPEDGRARRVVFTNRGASSLRTSTGSTSATRSSWSNGWAPSASRDSAKMRSSSTGLSARTTS